MSAYTCRRMSILCGLWYAHFPVVMIRHANINRNNFDNYEPTVCIQRIGASLLLSLRPCEALWAPRISSATRRPWGTAMHSPVEDCRGFKPGIVCMIKMLSGYIWIYARSIWLYVSHVCIHDYTLLLVMACMESDKDAWRPTTWCGMIYVCCYL